MLHMSNKCTTFVPGINMIAVSYSDLSALVHLIDLNIFIRLIVTFSRLIGN